MSLLLYVLMSRWRRLWRSAVIVHAMLLISAVTLWVIGYDSTPTRLVDALTSPAVPVRTGRLHTSVRNVFGDPVGGALVTIDRQQATAGDDGRLALDDVSVGWHVIHVQAPGYHPLARRLRIDKGDNEPLIKYEQGLWPIAFAADFHVFYAQEEVAPQRIFMQIGLANGSDLPLYIYDLYTSDGNNRRLDTLLDTPAGYERIALMYPHLSLATEPLALVLKPKGLVVLELPPLHITPQPTDTYFLTISYGIHDEALPGPTETLQLQQTAVLEPDLNPHRP